MARGWLECILARLPFVVDPCQRYVQVFVILSLHRATTSRGSVHKIFDLVLREWPKPFFICFIPKSPYVGLSHRASHDCLRVEVTFCRQQSPMRLLSFQDLRTTSIFLNLESPHISE